MVPGTKACGRNFPFPPHCSLILILIPTTPTTPHSSPRVMEGEQPTRRRPAWFLLPQPWRGGGREEWVLLVVVVVGAPREGAGSRGGGGVFRVAGDEPRTGSDHPIPKSRHEIPNPTHASAAVEGSLDGGGPKGAVDRGCVLD